jgi:hypothetical protein
VYHRTGENSGGRIPKNACRVCLRYLRYVISAICCIYDTARLKAGGREFQIFFRSLPRPCGAHMGGSQR